MADIKREIADVSVVENTITCRMYINGEHTGFEITPLPGVRLRDGRLDTTDTDGEIIHGFRTRGTTVGKDYDFSPHTLVIDGKEITAVGKYGFYTTTA